MKIKSDPFAKLTINTNLFYLPIVTSFVEKALETMALTLSSEEVFYYLCHVFSNEQSITLKCFDKSYYKQIDFEFLADNFNFKAFNLTHSIKLEDDAINKDLGLIIAARIVDRFLMEYTKGNSICLSLIKEKPYLPSDNKHIITPPFLKYYAVLSPSSEMIKLFSQQLTFFYKSEFYPKNFQLPGKLLDMINSCEYQIQLASDKKGEIGGGIVWQRLSDKTVESFGPYIFGVQEDKMAVELLDSFLSEISRTTVLNAVCKYYTDKTPLNYFEKLGSRAEKSVYLRQIKEDLGTSVWCHPELEKFLSDEYQRLVLPREIRLVKYEGEFKKPDCVIRANFEKENSQMTLFPLLNGEDIEENLIGYTKLFKNEKILNILFEMDLGIAWQTEFTPALLKLGFKPHIILPYAGISDIVVFQLEG